jgi:DNA-binding CsgD family transcriptional regulator
MVTAAARLTAREREIAELAGGGLTSVEIGRRLYLSARTVDSHLGRVYAKLAVANRTALAAVLLASRDADVAPAPDEPERPSVHDCTATAGGVPAQLPAGLPAFVARAAQLRCLDDLLAAAGDDGPVVCAVTGTAGVGKTTLAVHWAYRVSHHFPDGLLHVDLRGFHPSVAPVAPADAIRDFLTALDVPPDRIPSGPRALAALYRTTMAGRRMLVVLDNAHDADQIRPLLPGSSTAFVLVTSRDRLTSILATGAHHVSVDLLTEDEAVNLLATRVERRRVADEPAAAHRIIDRCARRWLSRSRPPA